MDVLLLSFSNDQAQPLPTLTEEYAALHRILSPRVLRQHFLAWTVSHATLDDIAFYLSLFQNRLRVFHYSGHAGRNSLQTEDGQSRTEGIVHLLAQCPNLKLVVLNGCGTAHQVEALHEAGVPLVIATSAPIEDRSATHFSKRLFQALETGLSVGAAFEQAVGASMAEAERSVYRSLGKAKAAKATTALWGIFPKDDLPEVLDWKLPHGSSRKLDRDFVENELLLDTLYEAFAAYNPKVKELYESGVNLEERKEEIVTALLKALPAPISEHVRKLIAPSPPGAEESWDRLQPARIQQIIQTYEIAMDFLVYVLIAQIWDNMLRLGAGWKMLDRLRPDLEAFFNLGKQGRDRLNQFTILQLLGPLLEDAETTFFIREFGQLKEDFLLSDEVKTACFFLESLQQHPDFAFPPSELAELSARAEESLAEIFGKLGFLGKYLLATVRNINVQKYRHTNQAQFEHMVVKWHGTLGFYDREYRLQREFMDNRSVVLLQLGERKKNKFLNLSPFIIDENTFEAVPDTSLSKLYFFAYRSQQDGHLIYKYINDPEGDIIDLDDPVYIHRRKKTSKFQLAKAQFEAFYEQILNQKPIAS